MRRQKQEIFIFSELSLSNYPLWNPVYMPYGMGRSYETIENSDKYRIPETELSILNLNVDSFRINKARKNI